MARDYRDIVIEDFADTEARLRERVASLERDVVIRAEVAAEDDQTAETPTRGQAG